MDSYNFYNVLIALRQMFYKQFIPLWFAILFVQNCPEETKDKMP